MIDTLKMKETFEKLLPDKIDKIKDFFIEKKLGEYLKIWYLFFGFVNLRKQKLFMIFLHFL